VSDMILHRLSTLTDWGYWRLARKASGMSARPLIPYEPANSASSLRSVNWALSNGEKWVFGVLAKNTDRDDGGFITYYNEIPVIFGRSTAGGGLSQKNIEAVLKPLFLWVSGECFWSNCAWIQFKPRVRTRRKWSKQRSRRW
jgi:hypothetical protein